MTRPMRSMRAVRSLRPIHSARRHLAPPAPARTAGSSSTHRAARQATAARVHPDPSRCNRTSATPMCLCTRPRAHAAGARSRRGRRFRVDTPLQVHQRTRGPTTDGAARKSSYVPSRKRADFSTTRLTRHTTPAEPAAARRGGAPYCVHTLRSPRFSKTERERERAAHPRSAWQRARSLGVPSRGCFSLSLRSKNENFLLALALGRVTNLR